MKPSTFQIILHSLRFLVAQLGIAATVTASAYVTWYLGAPKLVFVLISLIAVGAVWPLFEKIMREESRP